MKKKYLEKAITLFDNIPGIDMIDRYMSKLCREELLELERFLKFVKNDIDKMYDNDESEEYVDSSFKTYVGQLSEIHQCVFIYHLENESGRSIDKDTDTDITIKFKTYAKSTWSDQFKIAGEGKDGGISIHEFNDWDLLLRFIIEKDLKSAKSKEVCSADHFDELLNNAQNSLEKDSVEEIKMIDLTNIGNKTSGV